MRWASLFLFVAGCVSQTVNAPDQPASPGPPAASAAPAATTPAAATTAPPTASAASAPAATATATAATTAPAGSAAPAAGGLTPSQVAPIIAEQQQALRRACWAPVSLKAPAGVPVKLTSELKIAPDGSVKSVKTQGTAPDPSLTACLDQRLKAVKFPAAASETTVLIPFHFISDVNEH